jgi:hypothetical protein
MDLLCFALRPSHLFRHKLGMGKSLGLGTVRIDVDRIDMIDRSMRYLHDDPFSDPRVHWTDTAEDAASCARRYSQHATTQWPKALYALLLLGETGHAANLETNAPPVSAPLLGGVTNDEKDTYGWFSANTDSYRKSGDYDHPQQHLTPIIPGQPMPTLKRITKIAQPPRQGGGGNQRGGNHGRR